eukprot:m.196357 g.196357  ORF g.196357 m.196357 type:complete len:392 (-) comp14908_c1_seq9:1792-2967(-)
MVGCVATGRWLCHAMQRNHVRATLGYLGCVARYHPSHHQMPTTSCMSAQGFSCTPRSFMHTSSTCHVASSQSTCGVSMQPVRASTSSSSGAKSLNGVKMARKIGQLVKADIQARLKDVGRPPSLSVIRVGNDEASRIYVSHKEKECKRLGIQFKEYHLDEQTTQQEALRLIQRLNLSSEIDGILLQLPLPDHLNQVTLIQSICPTKDVDGLHAANVGNLISKTTTALQPCTPGGIMYLLRRRFKMPSPPVFLQGLHAVVVGASGIVGKPLAMELLNAGATVTVCHEHTKQLEQHVSAADVLIVATGEPQLVPGEWVKKGATVIDVGCHRDTHGKLVGEVTDVAKTRAAYITPVPGGVGPMTIAFLMKNTVTAWIRHHLLKQGFQPVSPCDP